METTGRIAGIRAPANLLEMQRAFASYVSTVLVSRNAIALADTSGFSSVAG